MEPTKVSLLTLQNMLTKKHWFYIDLKDKSETFSQM